MDEPSTPLAASLTFAYARYVPPCFTNPCGLVPVVAVITVDTVGPVLSTTTENAAGKVELPTTSLAATV
jgi:hypothetical protein